MSAVIFYFTNNELLLVTKSEAAAGDKPGG